MMRGFILALVLVLAGWFSWNSDDAGKKTRILFIGNSYTAQISGAVTALAEASPAGKTTEFTFIAPGGKSLEAHIGDAATVAKIKEGNWDYVVLQDQSRTPALWPERFETAAVGLDKLIDAAGAKTVFYQTWGRRDGDKQNAERFPTYESMQTVLSRNYANVAGRCHAILAPVGDSWAGVRAKDAKLGGELYASDGSHPSAKGAYLTACVFYKIFFQQDAAGIDFNSGLSPAEEKVMHQAVTSAMAQ
ncbi:DUF4886 domain-containing protein [Haloferula sp.]|uniref:DUF4886 domain-containing protein n=1 Tax=Haloferula sp. TaxID=2497595 RepID=UPI00329CB548